MRNRSRPGRAPARASGGLPAWLVFLIGIALVFGGVYLCQGVQNFIRTGGQGVVESTERAVVVSTATAERITRSEPGSEVTPRPTNTPVPECQDFVVSVPNAIIREGPSSGAQILTSLNEGAIVCVLGREGDSEWYVIDQTPETRRLDLVYMHETVIRAVNPTPTPSITPTPLPTITPLPSPTPSRTPVPSATPRRTTPDDARETPTATADPDAQPTIPPVPTMLRQTA